jgi:hypothetical protein
MNPNKTYEKAKKAHGNSREIAVRRRTARNAIDAHNATIRTSPRRTDPERREYLPQNHSNAEYQSHPTPITAKHHASHQGCALIRFSISCCLRGFDPNCRIDSRSDFGRSISAYRASKHFEQSSSRPARSHPQLEHLGTFGQHS